MVDDDVLLPRAAQAVEVDGVARCGVKVGHFVARAEAQVADDDIGSIHPHFGTGNADAVARSRLPGYRQVAAGDVERGGEFYRSGHVEDDGACSRLADGVAQASGGTRVVQRGHMVNVAASSAGGVASAAFCAGESYQVFRYRTPGFRLLSKIVAGLIATGHCQAEA